eukprot:NODE_2317_length_598_cov_64.133758_g2267_i0.p1 GENE.NODE_2317_length_598_cov_64.133758_g2267_i0~~NODE_2317_length_598_cov_64.133758_g2267_i0.p1  ORF type:complete len:120 (+),score=18.08 NODE_2317_length_598_cov_64.133758_g2267_i0:76-435(+)
MAAASAAAPETTPDQVAPEVMDDMFAKLSGVVQGEMQVYMEDLTLLENINKEMQSKYGSMIEQSEQAQANLKDVKAKYEELQPYLRQIEQLDGHITQLETAVKALGEYTTRLATVINEA